MASNSIEDGECSYDENILNFLNAVKSNDVNSIRNLLSLFSSSSSVLALIETNNKDNGNTPLHVAVMLGNFEAVKLIIDHIVQFGAANNIDITKYLLRKKNKMRNTMLHEAVKSRNLDIVKLLLGNDSSLVNSINEDGESPLFLAIDRELYEMASHILSKIEYGISSQEKGSWSGRKGLNVMHAAVIRNNHREGEITSIFQQDNDDHIIIPSIAGVVRAMLRRNPLTIGDGVIEKLLKKYGIDILEGKDDHGRTPLHYAAHFNEFDLILNMFLWSNTTRHNICCVQDNEGMSPLHIAAKNGSIKALESLKIRSGIYSYKMFELLDKNNRTALHVAVESQQTSLLQKMLSFKESKYIMNWKDKDGNTCFHHAALTGNYWVVSIMFSHRMRRIVDEEAVNNKGMTAIDILHTGDLHEGITATMSGRMFLLAMFHIRDSFSPRGLESVVYPKQSTSNDKLVQESSKHGTENISLFSWNMANVNLIMATIVASITFAAGVQIPGGYNDAGMAVLQEKSSFKLFMIFNSLGFGLSTASIFLTFLSVLFNGKKRGPLQQETLFTIFSLVLVLNIASIASSVIAYIMSTKSILLDATNSAWKIACFSFVVPIAYIVLLIYGTFFG